MAQPIYDDLGPLEEYLRMSGDLEVMPGSLAEFALEHEFDDHHYLKNAWVRDIISSIVRIVAENFPSEPPQSSQHEFAERFKYVVISSSLLASSLPQQSHSRTPSAASIWSPHDLSASHIGTRLNSHSYPTHTVQPHLPPALFLVSLLLVLLSLSAGHYITAFIIIAAVVHYAITPFHNQPNKSAQTTLPLDTLNILVDADAAWNAAVREAMSTLDKEGHSPISPTSPIRVSLHSCLQTTATQCDNIRQLFSPLIAPAELTQLSEMYAPSSPALSAHNLFSTPVHSRAPSGLLNARSTSILDKRSTWNGVLSQRPRVGLGISIASRQARDGFLDENPFPSPSLSSSGGAPLAFEAGDPSFLQQDGDGDPPFGVMALQLQRAYRTPKRQSLDVPKRKNISLRTSPTASRFTTLQKNRHPFSMTALQHSLQAALSSKRFSCCNLLALRFEDDEDDAYWEDVRSVIALFTSTLEDETARLVEALESSHLSRQREQLPTAPPTPNNPIVSPSHWRRTHHRLRDSISFAPQPSHLAKFISQAEAIESALEQASDSLRACTSSVRRLAGMPLDAEEQLESAASAALQAYETLRRDLGLALRNCERARDPLLGLVPKANDAESDSDEPAVPPLAQDHSSAADSDSGRGDPTLDSPNPLQYVSRGPSMTDDATRHLLDGTSTSHLPPPGEEQLFEAESAPPIRDLRERPSLSRAERIALAKAKRQSAQQSPIPPALRPGGEIVEELKQVISRVNDRKKHRLSLLRTPVAVPVEDDGSSDAFHSSTDSLLTTIPSYLSTSLDG